MKRSIHIVLCFITLGMSVLQAQQVLNEQAFSNVRIDNLSEINTKDHESSAFWIGTDTLAYVKFEQRSKDDSPTRGERIFDLHWASNSPSGFIDKGGLSKKLNSNYVEGPGHYIKATNILYFTRSYTSEKPDQEGNKIIKLKIFKAQKQGYSWSSPQLIEGLVGDYNFCHPAYDVDTRRLYFSSDIPGGFGGMDLYYSQLSNEGIAQTPINLGPQINTPANEVFPTLIEGNLFYSSSESGSLDIYATSKEKDELLKAQILPQGINSERDDFSLIKQDKDYYFTSNRVGGKGKDDLYRFSSELSFFKEKAPDSTIVNILIYDKITKVPIPEAEVSIYKIDIADGISNDVILDENDQLTVSYNLEQGSQLLVPKLPLSGEGSAFVILENGYQYLIKTQLDGKKVSSRLVDISQNKSIAIEITKKKGIPTPPPPPKTSVAPTPAISIPVAKGSVVIFENIYYDYNSATLQAGATAELDALAQVMLSSPTIKVQLSSHTDSRGREIYNQDLSDRRAASAKQYLVNKGIAPSRIFDIGFGESRIRNHCTEGVKCTEEEHKFNRRTEVKILED